MKPVGIALFLATMASPAVAAGQGWTAVASAGGTDSRTVTRDVSGTSATFGVRRDAPTWLYLAAGVPLDTATAPWAALGAGGRLATAPTPASGWPLALGIDAGAHGYGYRDGTLEAVGAGLTLEALPFVAVRTGSAALELHAGGRSYGSTFDDTTFARVVFDAGARLTFSPAPALSLTADARVVRSIDGSFPFTGLEAQYALGRVEGWASVGRYLNSALPDAAWAMGASLAVAHGFHVEVAAQQDASDPLYWNPVRRFWSLGVTRALGRARTAPPSQPDPHSASVLTDDGAGRVLLRLPLGAVVGTPAVGGDFNGWTPVEMKRAGDVWEAALDIAPGVYHYAFRTPDGSWFVPESFPNRTDDGFGGSNAVLLVPTRADPSS